MLRANLNAMGPLRRVLATCLLFSLVLNSVTAFAKDEKASANESSPTQAAPSAVPLSDAQVTALSPQMSEPLEVIANRRATEEREASPFMKSMRERRVQSYFPSDVEEGSVAWRESVASLRADAIRLHGEFEIDDKEKIFKNFVRDWLDPYLTSLTKAKLSTSLAYNKPNEPIGTWTMERLVASEQVIYLGRYKNFPKRAMEMLTGRHLKGVTATVALVTVAAAVGYASYKIPAVGTIVGGFFGYVGWMILTGPGADVTKALSGPVLDPTKEKIQVMRARYAGGFEQRVNHLIDSLDKWVAEKAWRKWWGGKPVPVVQAQSDSAKQNKSPRIALLDEDRTSLAGMTPVQQANNWTKLLHLWVAVRNTFMQLLRDVHHIGRVQMLISPHDEQAATIVVRSLKIELLALRSAAHDVLTRYENRIRSDRDLSRSQQDAEIAVVTKAFDLYEWIVEQQWRAPWMDESQKTILAEDIAHVRSILKTYGFQERDLAILSEIHTERAMAIAAMATGLALNDIRTLMTPESNRNLDPDARQFIRAIRDGFGNEFLTQRYLELVQLRIHKAGFEAGEWHEGKPVGWKFYGGLNKCEMIFEPTAGAH